MHFAGVNLKSSLHKIFLMAVTYPLTGVHIYSCSMWGYTLQRPLFKMGMSKSELPNHLHVIEWRRATLKCWLYQLGSSVHTWAMWSTIGRARGLFSWHRDGVAYREKDTRLKLWNSFSFLCIIQLHILIPDFESHDSTISIALRVPRPQRFTSVH